MKNSAKTKRRGGGGARGKSRKGDLLARKENHSRRPTKERGKRERFESADVDSSFRSRALPFSKRGGKGKRVGRRESACRHHFPFKMEGARGTKGRPSGRYLGMDATADEKCGRREDNGNLQFAGC